MYRLEAVSWEGTDILLSRFQNKSQIGGYFAYQDGHGIRFVFVSSEEENGKIIAEMYFDNSLKPDLGTISIDSRDFSNLEKDIWTVRRFALDLAVKDTFFKKYQGVSYNVIPIVNQSEKKVYILSAGQKHGVVYFGNDYLLTFDDNNVLTSKKKFHNSVIQTEYGTSKDGIIITGGAHSHLPALGQVISATDICTLMLYQKLTHWESYFVISADYVSIWDCKKNNLAVMTNEAFDKLQGKK